MDCFARLTEAVYRRLALGRSSRTVSVGQNVHVGPFSRLWSAHGLVIEDDVYIGKYCTIEVDGRIGAGSMIANSVGLVGRRDHAVNLVGQPVRFGQWVGDREETMEDSLVVGRDCWIGFGAILLSGIEIGDSVVVAAGSVVTKDFPRNCVVAGNPAAIVGERFSSGEFQRHAEILHERYGARR